MLIDTIPVSRWYVLANGFKAYAECSHCKHTNIRYFKVRMKNMKGISAECEQCEKKFPIRMKQNREMLSSMSC